jgi:Nif-specific regulatory protein
MQLWERPAHDEKPHERVPGSVPMVEMPRRQPMAASAPSERSAPPLAEGAVIPEPGPERVRWALEQSQWVQARAARLLGVTPRQLGYAMRKYGIPTKKL